MIASYVESDPTKFCTYEEFTEGVAALKEFCELRAESVRGQLDGIIPSTSEGQSADKSAFIDASDLSITAMGSMGNGGGPGGNGGQGGPDGSGDNGGQGGPDGNGENGGNPPTPPDGFNGNGDDSNGDNNDNNGFGGGNPPDMPGGGGQSSSGNAERQFPGNGEFPGNTEAGDSTSSSSMGTWILLGSCGVALLIGLLIAFFYKKKN